VKDKENEVKNFEIHIDYEEKTPIETALKNYEQAS
jgi:hypothetical protein